MLVKVSATILIQQSFNIYTDCFIKIKKKERGVNDMKKIIMVAALSLCCCMALTAKVKAAEKVSGNYHYEVLDESKKTATLTRVDNPGTNVVLPSKVDDYKITQSGTLKNNSYDYSSDWSQNAGIFREEQATALTQLVLPQGVEKIGINALKD